MSQNHLANLRQQMDQIDKELCELLLRRLTVSKEIQALKAKMGTNKVDTQREDSIVQQLYAHYSAIPLGTLRELYAVIFTWMRGPNP